jgi:hypothetical protein
MLSESAKKAVSREEAGERRSRGGWKSREKRGETGVFFKRKFKVFKVDRERERERVVG